MRHRSAELQQVVAALADGQNAITNRMTDRETDLDEARQLQDKSSVLMKAAKRKWPLDPEILNLGAYHLKNAYLLKHWNAVQAGSAPPDPLLKQAERAFIKTLWVDPTDPSALNGVGNVFFFERDLDAAEFFHKRALALAQKTGTRYEAAGHDLDLVQRFKGG
jgi:hypothetical protein